MRIKYRGKESEKLINEAKRIPIINPKRIAEKSLAMGTMYQVKKRSAIYQLQTPVVAKQLGQL